MYSIKSNNFNEFISNDKCIFTPNKIENNIIIINCFYKGLITFKVKQKNIKGIFIKAKDYIKTLNLVQKFDLKFNVEENDVIEIYNNIINPNAKIEIFRFDYKTDNQIKNIVLKKEDEIKFIIITTKLIESIAISIQKIIIKLGYQCKIIYELTIVDCINSTEKDIYIILFNISIHNLLPKKFIVYQLEQYSSNFFNEKKIEQLRKSNMIWEYCLYNHNKYLDISKDKILFQPIPFIMNNNTEKEIDTEFDIFFYGTPNNRRYMIINYLKNKYKIKIGFNCIGEEKEYYIKKSKIILNLHYYENASLETCRLNEILQYKKIVVSEEPASYDEEAKNLYKNVVFFIDEIKTDLSNINLLEETLNILLEENRYKKEIERIEGYKEELENICINYLSNNIKAIL